MDLSKLQDLHAEYGPRVGGHRYKKFHPPVPLAIIILELMAFGALITAAVLFSPQTFTKLVYKYLKYKISQPSRRQIQRSMYYLERKNFIAFLAGEKKKRFLTKLGLKRIKQAEFNAIEIKPIPWDGFWRFLVFDIPEKDEAKRYIFRKKLKELGFFHFQRSVFMIPCPCAKEIEKATTYLEIEPYAYLITANRFDGDEKLVKKFNLTIAK